MRMRWRRLEWGVEDEDEDKVEKIRMRCRR